MMKDFNSKEILEKAISNGLMDYDKPQYIVFNANHELEVEFTVPVGKIMVMIVSFTKKEVEDYLQKVDPELIPKLGNDWWKLFYDGDAFTKYPETEPGTMIHLQCALDDNIDKVRKMWGF